MKILPGKECFKEPSQLLKFFILFGCGVFTVFQVAQCVDKIMFPPISTHFHYNLNKTIKYPCLTICRQPAFKHDLFKNYGIPSYSLENHNAFLRYNFTNHTLTEFMETVTFNFSEVFQQFAFAGNGSNPELTITSSFHVNRGRCFTLAPQKQSGIFSMNGGYFLFLLHDDASTTFSDYGETQSGFQIYLHDPNEILTYDWFQANSFFEYLYLEASEEVFVEMTLQEFGRIPSKDNVCIPDPNYSRSKCQELCVHLQVATAVNCTLPWLMLTDNVSFAECNDFESVNKLIWMFKNRRSEYISNCYCPMSCNFTLYSTSIIRRKPMDEFNAPNSLISLFFGNNVVTRISEVAGYDWNQLLSDIGGSLGFLLGYDWNQLLSDKGGSLGFLLGVSVISFICMLEELFRLLFKWMWKRKNRRHSEHPSVSTKISNMVNENNNQAHKKEHSKAGTEIMDFSNLGDIVTNCNFYEKEVVDNSQNENKRIK